MVSRKLRQAFFGIAIWACFSLCAQCSFAQSLQTSINKKSILIGEQIKYDLIFTLPTQDYTIEFNLPDSFPHFDIISKIKSDSVDLKGHYLVLQRLVLTSFDSGKWPIISFPIKIKNAASDYTLNSDSITIDVGYAPADTSGQLRDIKPVMEVFVIDNTWIYSIIAAVIGLILLYFIYRYFKRRAKKDKPVFKSSLSPFDEAMQSLKKLKSYNLSIAAEVKEYHSALAEIFKKYYSRKDQRNLLNKTTSDILLKLKENQADVIIPSVAEALRCSDAVKFAKYLPPVGESEKSLEQIKNAIELMEKSQSPKNA
ncbi:MAG: hypothetical protein ABJA37_14170 [Ferruginibacter sp.]